METFIKTIKTKLLPKNKSSWSLSEDTFNYSSLHKIIIDEMDKVETKFTKVRTTRGTATFQLSA